MRRSDTEEDIGCKMMAQWHGDHDKLELGRVNACIVNAAPPYDDSNKFDDDGKTRRTGLELLSFLSLFLCLLSFPSEFPFYCLMVSVDKAAKPVRWYLIPGRSLNKFVNFSSVASLCSGFRSY